MVNFAEIFGSPVKVNPSPNAHKSAPSTTIPPATSTIPAPSGQPPSTPVYPPQNALPPQSTNARHSSPDRRGRPRKYDFGPVSDEEYSRLAQLEANKRQIARRRNMMKGEDVIVLHPNLEPSTPWVPTENKEVEAAYRTYITANAAYWAGVAQFKVWAHNEGQLVEGLRAAYVSAATKDQFGR